MINTLVWDLAANAALEQQLDQAREDIAELVEALNGLTRIVGHLPMNDDTPDRDHAAFTKAMAVLLKHKGVSQ